jgi:hypothetical protein
LRWLARQLQANTTVELLIEHIQPRWLEKPQAQRCYGEVIVLIAVLIAVLIGGLIGGRRHGALAIGLSWGLAVRRIHGQDNIEPVEAFKTSISQDVARKIFATFKQWLIRGLFYGLATGLAIGLIFGLIHGLVGLIWGLVDGELIRGLIFMLIFGLAIGLINGLIFGLISGLVGLIFELINGLKQDLQLRSRPNQGIWNSLQSMVGITALIYSLGIIFTFGILKLLIILEDLTQKESMGTIRDVLWSAFPLFLVKGIFAALFFGFLVGGGLACVQHVCLRFVLWQSGIAPWNLARFLNYCVERRLMQRVGGRYRFLHRELLDHFAYQRPGA